MSKETIKLYAPKVEKNAVEIMEVSEDAYKENKDAYLDLGLFETYPKAKKQLDFELKVRKIIKQLEISNCDNKLKEDIKNLKNDLDVIKRLERLEDKRFESIDTEQVHLSERIEQLSRKLNGKDNRVDALSDKIDNIKKESDRGQKMLLDRIKELESEVEGNSNTRLKSIINTLIGSFIGYILAMITLALVT